ncbi:helix-turn-helix transcriptional regulator [Streptosporangium sp. KLBMP 9127]|nr:AAA family ATPase [Streptosporangium sp. KLBMP 9127]
MAHEFMLYGRQAQQATIDQLLADLMQSRPGTLVVRGEAGIGKSALLEYAGAATQARVLRVTGVESEAGLPFAALHLLLLPVLSHLEALPGQQADAMSAALGLGAAPPADRFLIGLATLSLLMELSAAGPLLCLVDDAQWLDRESADALLFAVRRLHAEPIALIFAAREDGGFPHTSGLAELRLAGLDAVAAGELLAERSGGLALAVRDQLVAEARGNPLALRELPRTLSAEQRMGALTPFAFSAGGAEPVSNRVLAGFRDQIAVLPAATRACLLVAALDDRSELETLTRALAPMGASLADFAPAERAGLIHLTDTGVVFRHPLTRTAARQTSDVAQRMAAHRVLAGAVDDDRRAWHLAAVTTSPDERVALELDGNAVRARLRGGQMAVSAAYARAAELSEQPAARARRWAAAATASLDAGLWDRAGDLARRAGQPSEPAVAAELARTRAALAFEAGTPLEAVRLLHEGVSALGESDPATTLTLMGLAGMYAWASDSHPDQIELARRTEELTPRIAGPLGAVHTINRAIRGLLEGDVAGATAIPAGMGSQMSLPFELRVLAVYFGFARGDQHAMRADAERLVAECRAEGRIGRMPQALMLLSVAELISGRHRAARAGAAEGLRLAADVGQPSWRSYLAGVRAWLSAVAGAQEECRALAAEAAELAGDRAWMPGVCWAECALAALDLGLGRYEPMLDRVDRALLGPARHAFIWSYVCPDYIEAAVRAGTPRRAEPALARFAAWAQAVGQPWALAVLHRCHALMTPGDEAAARYEAALALHQEGDQPFEQARTRLLYGEWLRRQQRRAEARTHLETAMETFDRLGATPWSGRAAAELRATGLPRPARARAGDPLAMLTPQELQVVRLAAAGASNREIGAQLFLSPRTVAYHLYKAFPKLGISARAELARLALT